MNRLLETRFDSVFLDLKPMDHDSILQFDSKFAPILLLLVVVHKLTRIFKLVVVCLTQAVTDDVVKRWLLCVWVHKNHLLLGQSVVKLDMLLTKVFEVLDRDVVQ